jgi:hypothetical protein
MPSRTVYYVLGKVNELPKAERAMALATNDYPAIRAVLVHMFHPDIKFLLPEGEPPYKKSQFEDPGRLYTDYKKFYLFCDGGHNGIRQNKREQLFVSLLESVDPDEAELLIAMKEKKSPFKNITPALVKEAFPGLLPT